MCSLTLPQASPKLMPVNASQVIIRSIHPLYSLFLLIYFFWSDKDFKNCNLIFSFGFILSWVYLFLLQVLAAWSADVFYWKTRSHLLLRKCLCAFHSTKLRKQITSQKAICSSTLWTLRLVLVFCKTFESSCGFFLPVTCLPVTKNYSEGSVHPSQAEQSLNSKCCFRVTPPEIAFLG